jgi:hypothetical protein
MFELFSRQHVAAAPSALQTRNTSPTLKRGTQSRAVQGLSRNVPTLGSFRFQRVGRRRSHCGYFISNGTDILWQNSSVRSSDRCSFDVKPYTNSEPSTRSVCCLTHLDVGTFSPSRRYDMLPSPVDCRNSFCHLNWQFGEPRFRPTVSLA